jgi:hypothetical protein
MSLIRHLSDRLAILLGLLGAIARVYTGLQPAFTPCGIPGLQVAFGCAATCPPLVFRDRSTHVRRSLGVSRRHILRERGSESFRVASIS